MLLSELETVKPESIKTEEMIYIKSSEYQQLKNEQINIKMPVWVTARKWLNEKTLNEMVAVLKIPDDANETHAMIAISDVETNAKIGKYVGNDGLRDLRKIRAEQKKAEGAPVV